MARQMRNRAELYREAGRTGRRHLADRLARNSVYRTDENMNRALLRFVRD